MSDDKSDAPELHGTISVRPAYTVTLTTKGMNSYARDILHWARKFSLDADSQHPDSIGLPMMGVIAAATALESFVNEELTVAIAGSDLNARRPLELIQESKGLSLEGKWSLLLQALGCGQIAKGREPYQSFMALVKLRNELVHGAAKFYANDEGPTVMTQLTGKFAFRLVDGPWEQRVLCAACSAWAFNTAIKMINEHCRLRGRAVPEHLVHELIQQGG